MRAFFEVWDYETGNIINSVDTIDAALGFVRSILELNGPVGVRELGIVRQTPDATGELEPEVVLEGPGLLERLRALPDMSPHEAHRAAS